MFLVRRIVVFSVFLVSNKDLPPRFIKILSQGRGASNASAADELSLRPTSSIMPKTKAPGGGILSSSAQGYPQPSDHFVPPQPQPPNQKPTPPLLHKEPPILIKQTTLEKSKANKKDKVRRSFMVRQIRVVWKGFGISLECGKYVLFFFFLGSHKRRAPPSSERYSRVVVRQARLGWSCGKFQRP